MYARRQEPKAWVRQSEDFTVRTGVGEVTGRAGDWLARRPDGTFDWVRADEFEENYERFVPGTVPPANWIEKRRPGLVFDELAVRQRVEAIKSRSKEIPEGPWSVVGDPWDRRRTTVVGKPPGAAPTGDPHVSPLIVDCDNAAFVDQVEGEPDLEQQDRCVANFIAHSWEDLRFLTRLAEQLLAAKQEAPSR